MDIAIVGSRYAPYSRVLEGRDDVLFSRWLAEVYSNIGFRVVVVTGGSSASCRRYNGVMVCSVGSTSIPGVVAGVSSWCFKYRPWMVIALDYGGRCLAVSPGVYIPLFTDGVKPPHMIGLGYARTIATFSPSIKEKIESQEIPPVHLDPTKGRPGVELLDPPSELSRFNTIPPLIKPSWHERTVYVPNGPDHQDEEVILYRYVAWHIGRVSNGAIVALESENEGVVVERDTVFHSELKIAGVKEIPLAEYTIIPQRGVGLAALVMMNIKSKIIAHETSPITRALTLPTYTDEKTAVKASQSTTTIEKRNNINIEKIAEKILKLR